MGTKLTSGALAAVLILASGSLTCRPATSVSIKLDASNRCLSLMQVFSGRPLTFDTAFQIAAEIQRRPREQSLVVAWIASNEADLYWIEGPLVSDVLDYQWELGVRERLRESPAIARLMLLPTGGVLQYRERGGAVITRPMGGGSVEAGGLGLPGYSLAHMWFGPRPGLEPDEDRHIAVFVRSTGKGPTLSMAQLTEAVSERLRCRVNSLELRSDFWFRDPRLPFVYPFAGKDEPRLPPPSGEGLLGWCLMVDGKLRCEDYRDAKSK
ncbi:MAG: hypothetical protein J0L64_24685 [Acidobacteria bacterium]|nr:hypothetical protein [Acidobacteriota bacterium]